MVAASTIAANWFIMVMGVVVFFLLIIRRWQMSGQFGRG